MSEGEPSAAQAAATTAPNSEPPQNKARGVRGSRPAYVALVVALVVALIVVVVVVGVVALRGPALALFAPAASATPVAYPNGAVVMRPQDDGLTCPADVAWSPDSAEIALLGYAQCPTAGGKPSSQAGVVLLYDAATGALIRRIAPNPLAQRDGAVALPPLSAAPGRPGPYIHYLTALWSADGKTLALPFIVEQDYAPRAAPYLPNYAPPTTRQTTAGVLLIDVANPTGGATRVIAAPYREGAAPLEWDLTSGRLITGALNLTPALGYRWGAAGALIAQSPLSATTAATTRAGPVGDTIGGASFTIWQPGEIAPGYQRQDSGSYNSVNGVCQWYSQFAVWSPGGRYLVTPGYVGGLLAGSSLPTPDPTALAEANTSQALTLSPRDATMTSLCQQMRPDIHGNPAAAQAIAWRPDGRILAVTADPYFSDYLAASATLHGVVTLYADSTGRPLKTLSIPTDSQAPLNNLLTEQTIWLRWSPDGSRLLLLDLLTGTFTVWPV